VRISAGAGVPYSQSPSSIVYSASQKLPKYTKMADTTDPSADLRDMKSNFYIQHLDTISDETRSLLEEYSKIPADQVKPHCMKVRDEAWQVFPYPCIGQWRFLDLSIGRHPSYPEILKRLQSGTQKYLDLGCCFGQDIRRLVHDGVVSENCFGSDLRLDFMELGYDLFLDKETLRSRFIPSDVFDPESELKVLNGRIDIIHAASFFHLFSRDEQVIVGKRCVELLKPQKDSLIVGRQVGNIEAGEFPHRTNPNNMMFRHDIASWTQLWKEIGNATGTEWDVKAELHEWPIGDNTRKWQNAGARQLRFTLRRV